MYHFESGRETYFSEGNLWLNLDIDWQKYQDICILIIVNEDINTTKV